MVKESSQFDGRSIEELEQAVRQSLSTHKNAIIEAAKVLKYLRETKRFRENKRYAREIFDVYVRDLFAIDMKTYYDWTKALCFEPEAKAFGVGLVARTLRRCGPIGAKKAFTEIAKLEEVKKAKTVPIDKIDDIIVKNQSQRYMDANIKKVITDWKSLYEREREAHEGTKSRLAEARATIAELRDQVDRLKGTALAFDSVRDIVDGRFNEARA